MQDADGPKRQCPDPEHLSAWYDSELKDDELASHLAECPRCQRRLRGYRNLDRKLDEYVAVSPDVVERIKLGSLRRLAAGSDTMPYPNWLRVAAAMAALLVLCFLVLVRMQETAPSGSIAHHLAPLAPQTLTAGPAAVDSRPRAPETAEKRFEETTEEFRGKLRVVRYGDDAEGGQTTLVSAIDDSDERVAVVADHVRHVWLVEEPERPLRRLQKMFPRQREELQGLIDDDESRYVLQIVIDERQLHGIVNEFYISGFKLLSPDAPQPGQAYDEDALGRTVQYEVNFVRR